MTRFSRIRTLIRKLDKELSLLLDVGEIGPRYKPGPPPRTLRRGKRTCPECHRTFGSLHGRRVRRGLMHRQETTS